MTYWGGEFTTQSNSLQCSLTLIRQFRKPLVLACVASICTLSDKDRSQCTSTVYEMTMLRPKLLL